LNFEHSGRFIFGGLVDKFFFACQNSSLLMPMLLVFLQIIFLCSNSTNSKFLLRKTFVGIATFGASFVSYCDYSFAVDSAKAQFGVVNNRLLKCNAQSNCISSSSVTSLEKYGRPWEYSVESKEIFEKLQRQLQSDSSFNIKENDDQNFYIRVETKSAFPPTGTDDVEFLLNDKEKIITYRSNSRDVIVAGPQVIGDGGSNRNRLEKIRRELALNEMGMTKETEKFIKKEENLLFFQRLRELSQPSEVNFLDDSVPSSDA
jgi:uncharacterized protein (DUF1499 family)